MNWIHDPISYLIGSASFICVGKVDHCKCVKDTALTIDKNGKEKKVKTKKTKKNKHKKNKK